MSEKFSTKRLIDAISAGMLRHAEEDAIIARLRAGDNLENKSLMKLASDLGVPVSAAKILEDHVRAEHNVKITKADALCEAAQELVEVADLRGDADLPHPSNDPKLWTARMQTAWDDIRKAIAEYEGRDK